MSGFLIDGVPFVSEGDDKGEDIQGYLDSGYPGNVNEYTTTTNTDTTDADTAPPRAALGHAVALLRAAQRDVRDAHDPAHQLHLLDPRDDALQAQRPRPLRLVRPRVPHDLGRRDARRLPRRDGHRRLRLRRVRRARPTTTTTTNNYY